MYFFAFSNNVISTLCDKAIMALCDREMMLCDTTTYSKISLMKLGDQKLRLGCFQVSIKDPGIKRSRVFIVRLLPM
jgi:hypothetical protein